MLTVQSNSELESVDGIWIENGTRERFQAFEEQYLLIRDKEHRIFSIDEIRKLPEVNREHPHYQEWKIRQKSIDRFLHFLKGKKMEHTLDIGSGTGFFAHMLTRYCQNVAGVEVNFSELKQAVTAFENNERLKWFCVDIMQRKVFAAASFDLITFCCSFQYFPDVKEIIDTCFYYLKPGGSVHIIDTPFYDADEVEQAKKASQNYYQSMGFGELAQHYFHHSWDSLVPYDPVVHYRKKKRSFLSFFDGADSPFPWIELIKP
jgi:SAM-dependent methyltransferase